MVAWHDSVNYSTLEALRIIRLDAVGTFLQLCIGRIRKSEGKGREMRYHFCDMFDHFIRCLVCICNAILETRNECKKLFENLEFLPRSDTSTNIRKMLFQKEI